MSLKRKRSAEDTVLTVDRFLRRGVQLAEQKSSRKKVKSEPAHKREAGSSQRLYHAAVLSGVRPHMDEEQPPSVVNPLPLTVTSYPISHLRSPSSVSEIPTFTSNSPVPCEKHVDNKRPKRQNHPVCPTLRPSATVPRPKSGHTIHPAYTRSHAETLPPLPSGENEVVNMPTGTSIQRRHSSVSLQFSSQNSTSSLRLLAPPPVAIEPPTSCIVNGRAMKPISAYYTPSLQNFLKGETK